MWVRSPEALTTPWRALLLAALVAVVLPMGLGLGCLGLLRLLEPAVPQATETSLWAAGTVLLLSPMLSLPSLLLILPLASLLIRLGWFGWLPAATVGLFLGAAVGLMIWRAPGGVGWAIGTMTDVASVAFAGAAILLILRTTLGLLRPMGARDLTA
jgi:hypothetical protein